MDVVLPAAGFAVVLVATLDVFFTVLFPASGHGPIREPLSRFVWHVFRLVWRISTVPRRRHLLSYSGPVLITVTLTAWFLLLVVGWAMIYQPALGTGIRASSGPTDTSWATALYFSGFNLTTLGVGDVTPTTGVYRLLAIAEAALGFAFFSMVITYFLSVYSSLIGRNAFAQGLHHLSGNTGDAAELIVRMADGDDLAEARRHLSEKAGFLRDTHQTQRFYPVLRYFHYREPQYALPRVLLVSLDTAALIRSAVDSERYAGVIRSPGLNDLFDAAWALMHELVPSARPLPPSERKAEEWRDRFRAARTRFGDSGLRVCDDPETGAAEYVALRARWDQPVRELAANMLYDWDDVAPEPMRA
jgi:hypothetical protein